MTLRANVLAAALAFACSAGLAMAQQAPTGEGISPEVLKRLLPAVPAGSQAAIASPVTAGGSTLSSPGSVPTGWNYFHAYNCMWYSDGNNNYLFVLPLEGGYWVVANNIYAADTFKVGCVNGYYEAVYVVNGTTGAFTNIETFPYR